MQMPENILTSFAKQKMQDQPSNKLVLIWILVTLSLISQGWGGKCGASEHAPTVQQTQVGTGKAPTFAVEVRNNCPMCPVIDVHLRCGSFPQALVNPRLLKVVGFDDCVVNAGLPLQPLQKLSFNYTHSKYLLRPNLWFFQCE